MWITEHLLHVTQTEPCGLFYKVIQHPDLIAILSQDIIIQRDIQMLFYFRESLEQSTKKLLGEGRNTHLLLMHSHSDFLKYFPPTQESNPVDRLHL